MLRARPPLLLIPLLLACGSARTVADGPRTEPVERPAPGGDGDLRARVMATFMDATRARLAGDLPHAVEGYETTLRLDPKNAAAMYELAKLYHAGQRMEPALTWARKAVATDKENIWYRFLLADLNTQDHHFIEAAEVYKGITQKWPDHYEVYFDLANAYARGGKVAEARKVYDDLEKKIGRSEDLVMNEFEMLANAGALEEARTLLEDAIARDPSQPVYHSMLAEVYDHLRMPEQALAQYEELLRLDPSDNMTRISLAQHWFDASDFPKAFEQLHVAFTDPDLGIDPKMQLLLSFYEMTSRGDMPENERAQMKQQSYSLINTLKQAHAGDGKPFAIEGDMLLRDGEMGKARDSFRKAADLSPDKFPIQQQLLELDLRLSDNVSLEKDAAAAIELFPTVANLHLYRGTALSGLGRHDEAIEELITGRDLVVDDNNLLTQFWTSLGDAYHEAAKHADSDASYDKALALSPDNANTLNNYAYFLSLRGEKLDKAERMSKRSNELAPNQTSYMDTYAWVLFKLGKFNDARTWIEKAVAGGAGNSGEVLEHYGDILFRLDDAAGALQKWKEAQALGGTSTDIDRKVSEGRLAD